MFVTLLKFSENRATAPEFMVAHNNWVAQGFADGAFLCVGSTGHLAVDLSQNSRRPCQKSADR
ncbi:hypothetical protein E9677_16840 [Rhizobium rhizophilum]|uniref:Uncharacterized protein n=1 Tax=Rhizobium rhizophilum TaxID=1850373 RepID=A0ABY2QU27_9HYPH|nr:hypothetical protein E9677_16840 [Rhizobium rhizophilum]